MMNVATLTLASVPVILAVVQLFKGLGLPSKWSPLLAVVLGIGFSLGDLFTIGTQGHIYPALVTGVTLGLSAAGLYDGVQIARNAYAPRHSEDHSVTVEE